MSLARQPTPRRRGRARRITHRRFRRCPAREKAPEAGGLRALGWLRGKDLNLRPSGYEPDELPGCSTPRWVRLVGPRVGARGRCSTIASRCAAGLATVMSLTSYRAAPPRVIACCGPRGGFGRPGGDLLFRALRRSTIGAEGFHGRVRDGIGCDAPRYGHQAVQSRRARSRVLRAVGRARPRTSRARLPAGEASCVGLLKAKACRPGFRRSDRFAGRLGVTALHRR